MREGWKTTKLSEVCEKITDGTHQTPKYFNSGFVFLSSRNVTSGKINWDNIKYIDEAQHIAMQKRVSPRVGDILLAKNGTTGVAAMVDRDIDFDIYVSLAWLRPLEAILPDYLLHFVNSPVAKKQFNKRLKGVGVPNLHLKEIREVSISFPPLAEQKRIVAVLDEAFEGIAVALANAEKNLANVRELFETTLNATFTKKGEGWVEFPLKDVTTKIGSGATPRGGASAYKSEGISLIRSLNVYDRRFTDRKLAFIDDVQADKLSNVVVEKGDVLFNITGASVARCCTAPPTYLPARVNQHVAILRPITNALSTDFLCYLMTSRQYKEQLLGIGDEGGSTRQAITKKQLQDLKIIIPKSVEEQNKIASKLKSISNQTQRLEAIYQQKLAAIAELKQTLLQKAFAGELTADMAEAKITKAVA